MLWLIFDGWICCETRNAYGFSFERTSKIIDLFIPRSQIGLVTYSGGDGEPGDRGYPAAVGAVQMQRWLAEKLAEEHDLEYEE